MKKVLLLITVILIFTTCSYAQMRQVSGRVIDSESGETLIGVSVSLKGTTTGASTDANGTFRMNVPASGNSTLVATYLGYKTQEIAVGSQTQITISMQTDAVMLNEVVAIGYATVQRRDLNSAVSSVNAAQLRDIPINSTAEALTGRLAGVQITQSEGSPNASAQIRVRGGGSITQDNSPLYVVDGVQVEDALSNLAPQDIAAIDVLKDASATAIYGARGANGVVIITTKGGKEAKPTITYAENIKFICHSGSAAIWHDGSKNVNAKSVIKDSEFTGFDGFKLGRYHRDAQIYLINNKYSANMSDTPIYQAESSPGVLWGHRIFFAESKKQNGSYKWLADNLRQAPGSPEPKDITLKWAFDGKWYPSEASKRL